MKTTSLRLKIPYPMTFILIVVTYFMMSYHYWFVQLLGGYVIRVWIPIIAVSWLYLIKRLIYHEKPAQNRKVVFLNILIFVYYFFVTISILGNEEDVISVGRYLLHFGGSFLLYIVILGTYRSNEAIEKTIKYLYLIAIMLSLYIIIFFAIVKPKAYDVFHMDTNVGELGLDTISTFVSEGDLIVRKTIPGINANSSAYMLFPMILVGLYFFKKSMRTVKYLYFTGTVLLLYTLGSILSRGSLIALFVALIYLSFKKWFNWKQISVGILLFVFLFPFKEDIYLRMLEPLSYYFNIGSDYIQVEKISTARFETIQDTLDIIKEIPLIGIGITNFNNRQLNRFDTTTEHNEYIRMIAERGIFSFLSFIFIIGLLIYLFYRVLENRKSQNIYQKDLGELFAAGLIGFIIHLHFAGPYNYLWIWLAFSVAWIRNLGLTNPTLLRRLRKNEKRFNP